MMKRLLMVALLAPALFPGIGNADTGLRSLDVRSETTASGHIEATRGAFAVASQSVPLQAGSLNSPAIDNTRSKTSEIANIEMAAVQWPIGSEKTKAVREDAYQSVRGKSFDAAHDETAIDQELSQLLTQPFGRHGKGEIDVVPPELESDTGDKSWKVAIQWKVGHNRSN